MIGSKAWWSAAGIRAIKTFAQYIISSGIVLGTINATTDWVSAGWTAAGIFIGAALAAGISLLTSLAGLPEVQPPTPPDA